MSCRVLGGLAVAVLAGALALAGCSSTSPAPAPASPSSPTAAPVAAEHNAADVTFAQSMIPHHAQAIAMASQASSRAASAQVKDLASRIEAAQGPEIEQMNTMLAAWGAPTVSPSATAMPGMPGMAAGAGMPGMMSDGQMSGLAGTTGPVFDQAFLQMMIQHHSGAITMARTELAQGLNPQAKALANSIIADQQREIGEMQSLLKQG
jgi:uncharacterized protein (DUF305 family)